MMAMFERRDMYEAMQVGRYRPDRSTKAELRAITWMGASRVLRHAPTFCGAAAAAAHAARRGRGLGREQGGEDYGDVSPADDVWNVDSAFGTVKGLRKRRAASYPARPRGGLSLRASAAEQTASAADSRAGAKALGDITAAQRDRALTALISSPALRDQQSFKDILSRRADEII